MEWYIRFKGINPKWQKAYKYQIRYVENYLNHGIIPLSTSDIKLIFTNVIKKEDTIYVTYLNECGEIVEMMYNTSEKAAYINRITDF
uniref:Uncharacterized protein n=1 Tax=viral metagenome TaxID=1070528 RepID=A0A6C0D250_9ZZZZ